MATGRFAPSPTGDLHLGNLRTALVAWLFARSAGDRFVLRVEDLDRVTSRRAHEVTQRRDLAAIGVDWDGDVVRQSERFHRYEAAIRQLEQAGLTYACYCSRREIREAATAPNGPAPEGAYPGTCRNLTRAEAAERQASGRPAALRLRAGDVRVSFTDRIAGPVEATVDDVVLRRNDGVPSYNLAVVIDDADQNIGEVVRGDDLLLSTPRHLLLGRLLDLPAPEHAHVPLVLGPDGRRLAKRHGAVTLGELVAAGRTPDDVRRRLAVSLGLAAPDDDTSMPALTRRFDPALLPRRPWMVDAAPDTG